MSNHSGNPSKTNSSGENTHLLVLTLDAAAGYLPGLARSDFLRPFVGFFEGLCGNNTSIFCVFHIDILSDISKLSNSRPRVTICLGRRNYQLIEPSRLNRIPTCSGALALIGAVLFTTY